MDDFCHGAWLQGQVCRGGSVVDNFTQSVIQLVVNFQKSFHGFWLWRKKDMSICWIW